MRFLLPFLLALSCLAQPSPINRRAMAIAGLANAAPFTPQSAPGLAYWWVHSDLATNTAVTNWVDRIQGVALTNGASAERPTNSQYGVGFSGPANGTLLTNATLTLGTNFTIWLVANQTKDMSYQQFITPIIGTNGNQFNFNMGFLYGGDAKGFPGYIDSFGAFHPLTSPAFFMVNSNYDYAVAISNTPLSGCIGWTNGVIIFNEPTVGQTTEPGITAVGNNRTVNDYFVGYIREIGIWTQNVSTADVFRLHQYKTNKYGMASP